MESRLTRSLCAFLIAGCFTLLITEVAVSPTVGPTEPMRLLIDVVAALYACALTAVIPLFWRAVSAVLFAGTSLALFRMEFSGLGPALLITGILSEASMVAVIVGWAGQEPLRKWPGR
jgi:hypothetical protein